MAGKNRRFVVAEYKDANGKIWNKDQIANKILNYISDGGRTVSQMAQRFKLKASAINAVLSYMHHHNIVNKDRINMTSRFVYTKAKDCLLSELLYPSARDIEKKFKVKSVIRRTVDDGTSKGFGYKGFEMGGQHYLSSVFWSGAE